jgi:hypothetical protein
MRRDQRDFASSAALPARHRLTLPVLCVAVACKAATPPRRAVADKRDRRPQFLKQKAAGIARRPSEIARTRPEAETIQPKSGS